MVLDSTNDSIRQYYKEGNSCKLGGGGSDEPIKNVNKLVKNLVTTGNTTVNDCHASRNTM